MKIKYTQDEYDNAKSRDKLPLECCQCKQIYHRNKHIIKMALDDGQKHNFCSRKCMGGYNKRSVKTVCGQCGKSIIKRPSRIKVAKTGKVFCNKSCAALYNNAHKLANHRGRRSKIEEWIEQQLTELYPNLDLLYNDRTAISPYELDIYIPSLNLAFEINGIFHYEPIFGKDKLKIQQTNDKNKFYLCQQSHINLCIIDTSSVRYLKPERLQKYLGIICDIINKNL